MDTKLRPSGIEGVGDMPWGTHFCLFYETKEDLLNILIPYFRTGLENHEACLWVTPEPLSPEEAQRTMRAAGPAFERPLAEGQIEIVSYKDWYLAGGRFDIKRVLQDWIDKHDQAIARGYAGLRCTGNTFWLEKQQWDSFAQYEVKIDEVVHELQIIVLCTYPLESRSARDVLDVVHQHQFTVAKRNGVWEHLEGSELKQAHDEIRKLNSDLERRVVERTAQLAATNEQLKLEIIERKQAEALLHTREQEFRAFVENAPDQIIRYDKEFRRTYVNPAVTSAYGLPKEAFIGKPVGSIVEDAGLKADIEQVTAIRRQIKSVFDTGQATEFEVTFPSQGDRRTYWTRMYPEFDPNSVVINVLAISRDITDRKRAEEALRRSEEKFKALFESAPVGIALLDRERKIVDMNPVLEQIMRINKEALLAGAHRSRMYIRPDGTPRPFSEWASERAINENQPIHGVETGIVLEDGRLIWVQVNAVPLGLPDASAAVITQDITEHKQAEAAVRSLLRISEKLHATLDIDALLDSLVIEAMRLIDAEIGWSGLRTEEGMVCHTHIARDLQVISFPYLWPPEVGLPGWVLVHKVPYVMNDAQSDKMIIPEIRERFGVKAAIDTPILDAQGEVIGFFEVNNKKNGAGFSESDVEKLVAVSRIASIALQNARLFEAVSEHRRQLLVLSARLAEAQETERRAIARELHDEFGQSLTALKIDLAWLQDHLPPRSKSLHEKVDSALDLTNETIQMTQRLAGQLRPRMLDDLGLAAALEWHVHEWSKHTRIKTKVTLPKEEWELGPSLNTALYRVCQEALTNVARHAGASKVEVSLAREGDEVVLTVRDNGHGMDGGKITAPESLGLLGMKERVEQIGGRLEIQSEAGKGTTVVARVPVSQSLSPKPSHPSPKERGQVRKVPKGRGGHKRKS